MSDSENYETTFNHFLLRHFLLHFLRYLCNFYPNTCSQEAILMKVSYLGVVTLLDKSLCNAPKHKTWNQPKVCRPFSFCLTISLFPVVCPVALDQAVNTPNIRKKMEPSPSQHSCRKIKSTKTWSAKVAEVLIALIHLHDGRIQPHSTMRGAHYSLIYENWR
jgi:hypothetical protein